MSEDQPDLCAICGCGAHVRSAHLNLYQVYCDHEKHRTMFYQYRYDAVDAWNRNQRHKKSQRSKHG